MKINILVGMLLCAVVNAETVLIHNFTGHSVNDKTHATFDAMLIRDGRVVTVGKQTELVKNKHDKKIDLTGQFVLPGIIDAHGHVMGLGEEQRQVDLRGSNSVDEALQRIAAYAKAHPEEKWILGRGWNQVLWTSKQFPTAADLDRIVNDRPVYLERIDGHAAWINSVAIKKAQLHKNTVIAAGGDMTRLANGEPAGVLIDNAMPLVAKHLPPNNAQKRRETLIVATKLLASLGITGTHDAGVSVDDFSLYEELAKKKQLPIRIYAMFSGDAKNAEQVLAQGPRAHLYNDMLDFRSMKLYGDGALGSRGALLLEDYSDQTGNRGLAVQDKATLTRLTQIANHYGWQVNVHAIGDAANRTVLDIFAGLPAKENPRALRHRIEHAQIITLADIPRFAELNVIASMQPIHATSDMNMAEDRLGNERIKGGYAWRKLLNSGARIASGSDFPVELANPFLGLYAAVTRQDQVGNPPNGWYGEEKLSRAEALRTFTYDAAYAGHSEDRLGSLDAGKWADFIVIDRDYFSVPEKDIATTKVLQTWVAGKRVY